MQPTLLLSYNVGCYYIPENIDFTVDVYKGQKN